MKLAYIVYNERPNSGLMHSQVYSLLKEIARQDPSISIELIAFWQPWVAWRYRREIRAVRAELRAAGVDGYDVPWAIIPSRHFLYKTWLFPLLKVWVTALFAWVLRKHPDVVHCRGYLASFIATLLARTYGYRTVFDMRSLWPKEHVTVGAWRTTDAIHRMWQRIEAETLRHADAAVGVSEGMLEEILRVDAAAANRAVMIPIAVDTAEFQFDAEARSRRRAEIGADGKKLIVYQGSLGLMNSNLGEIAEYLGAIARWLPEAMFLILTSNTTVNIPDVLNTHGLPPDRYIVRHPGRGELPGWLSAADAGIHAMSPGPDSATRLGAKVVEYLSCALPIIVNPYVGAAADLVRQHGVGLVLDLADETAARRGLENFFARNCVPNEESRALALQCFSVTSCARSYRELYGRLLKA